MQEPVRLFPRCLLKLDAVREPEAVALLDASTLDLEDQNATRGVGDDKVGFGVGMPRDANAKRVPGVPALGQLAGERFIYAPLSV